MSTSVRLLPVLKCLGGPGMSCKSPQNYSWTEKALDKGYQVLFLDQRGKMDNILSLQSAEQVNPTGTGLSSTVTEQTIARQGGPLAQATYLRHFRADSIALKDYEKVRPGGLAPLAVQQPDPVYQKLYDMVAVRNRSYYNKYPLDIQRVKNIIHFLQTEKVTLPSCGGIDIVHEQEVVLRLASDLDYHGYLTRPSLAEFESLQSFDDSPLYALIHEMIYLQGWSADRIMKDHPAFMNVSTTNSVPIFFTGEMIYPSMFRDYVELRNLATTADILAQMTDWPNLYDTERLANNEVPVYASIYMDDMYVAYDFAQDSAKKIKNCKYFITNAMYHNAIGAPGKSEEVFKQLFALRDDVMD
ncbi:MAG: hypothetical protein Q9213_006641 [Squamulea squamosa]